jgi:glyoxylase-like metal-dependent hydrolase (beta-lactamase superfamily II)
VAGRVQRTSAERAGRPPGRDDLGAPAREGPGGPRLDHDPQDRLELTGLPGLQCRLTLFVDLDAGEAKVLPGVILIPTPGHTEGHQSLVVRKSDGTVVVAGRSHDTAKAYSADALAWRAHRDNRRQHQRDRLKASITEPSNSP